MQTELTEIDRNNETLKTKANLLNKRLSYVEALLWFTVGSVFLIPFFLGAGDIGGIRYSYSESFELHYSQLIVAFIIAIFPILYKIIFQKLPFESVREYFLKKRQNEEEDESTDVFKNISDEVNSFEDLSMPPRINYESLSNDNIYESASIANKIYNRSGAYLLVGSLIAIGGILIFYSPWFAKTSNAIEISQRLLDYLPRFGALFFIEFIAFFFLKQYRLMMEEYRYYEAIKRKRQDEKNFILLIEHHQDNEKVLKIISDISMTGVSKHLLGKEETTQILETQRLLNQESDFLGKITDMVKTIKNR